ncbi:hypothetical protein TNCV_3809161 [Trichonephila clavipes]|nr:hypothetical protein TNCV_3809161 [Trichonephila clavipes]
MAQFHDTTTRPLHSANKARLESRLRVVLTQFGIFHQCKIRCRGVYPNILPVSNPWMPSVLFPDTTASAFLHLGNDWFSDKSPDYSFISTDILCAWRQCQSRSWKSVLEPQLSILEKGCGFRFSPAFENL